MRRDDARRLAREFMRDLVHREQTSGASGFLSYKLLRRLVVNTQVVGVRLEQYVVGPWQVGEAEPELPSRPRGFRLPTVERGAFRLLAPHLGEAQELAWFLNWCNAPEPVPT